MLRCRASLCLQLQLVCRAIFENRNENRMTDQSLNNRIKTLLCTTVAPEIDIQAVGDDDRLIEDLNLDSLQLLGLISELEREFNFMLDDEDLDLNTFNSIATVADFVARKLS